MNSFRNFLLGIGVGSVLLGASLLPSSAQTSISGVITYIVRGDATVVGDTEIYPRGGGVERYLFHQSAYRLSILGGVFGDLGRYGNLLLSENSYTDISGGTFGGEFPNSARVSASNRSSLVISGGTFGGEGRDSGNVGAAGSSQVRITGGTFGGIGDRSGNVRAFDSSTVAIVNGTFGGTDGVDSGNVEANGSSQVTVAGGRFAGKLRGNIVRPPSGLHIQDEGEYPTITWSGGTFEGGVFLGFEDGEDGGGGDNLRIQNDDPGPELIINGNGLFYETESDHFTNPDLYGDRVFDLNFLSGTLLDGTQLQFVPMLVEHGSNALITLNNVPEPGSIALLVGIASMGGIMLRRKRK